MTLEEWINSVYNIDRYVCYGDNIQMNDNSYFTRLYVNINSSVLVDRKVIF